jgi:twitching motility protein PilT
LLDEEMTARFENRKELDFSFQLEDVARFRANVFIQRGKIACAIRIIPFNIWSIEECGLPEDVVRGFCQLKKGLVLVTGATGSGKSTTLASMVDEINSSRKSHIVTVEDPIEFVHDNKLSIVDQRQVTEDTPSFNSALTHVLRQDPDVILIGEMRDLETIQSALVIADTGHLVLATLHTSDSIQTINRIIDVFPSHQQKQIRAQLSFVLSGILSQQLIPCADREGRVLAAEILVATPAIRSMIRDAKEAQIYSVLQTSQKAGMRTMNQALSELCALGAITKEEALARTSDPHELMNIIK